MTREPVLVAMSILAALQALTGAAVWTEAVPAPWAGLIVAGVAAAQVGMAVYVRGRVTPVPGNPQSVSGS